ncbi:MAG: serine protein kinase RIO [Candidatus ainarchaeum sp.]|nr:serine protein kinase RIO [Candidatus ainarchaeum sp.]
MDVSRLFGEKFKASINNFERTRKIYREVFDNRLYISISKLYSKKVLDTMEGLISTGKEANVFLAHKNDKKIVLKIFRRETTSFSKFLEYVESDPRFPVIKKNRAMISNLMAQKEFRNLKVAAKAGCLVPEPIKFIDNIVAMGCVGDPEITLDKLNKAEIEANKEIIFRGIEDNMKALKKGRLVHGDLSEYNIIFWKDVYFIDMSQSTTYDNPRAKKFYLRDLQNIKKLFEKYKYKSEFVEKEIEGLI